MFIANDEFGNKIAIDMASPEGKYYCPICGSQLITKAIGSQNRAAHFAHKRNNICLDSWSYDMSEWHRNWQNFFPINCREVVLEFNGIKHRADILINNTIIEFQHSPISAQEISDRNKFYTMLGYDVVWVFDATNRLRNCTDSSINPCDCRENDLYWKRKQTQFSNGIISDVKVFLNYTFQFIDNEYGLIEDKDTLIQLTDLTNKEIRFRSSSPFLIEPDNFLKEYGAITDEAIDSITIIFQKADNYRKNQQQKAYANLCKKIDSLYNPGKIKNSRIRL